jgi:hypothetical protein
MQPRVVMHDACSDAAWMLIAAALPSASLSAAAPPPAVAGGPAAPAQTLSPPPHTWVGDFATADTMAFMASIAHGREVHDTLLRAAEAVGGSDGRVGVELHVRCTFTASEFRDLLRLGLLSTFPVVTQCTRDGCCAPAYASTSASAHALLAAAAAAASVATRPPPRVPVQDAWAPQPLPQQPPLAARPPQSSAPYAYAHAAAAASACSPYAALAGVAGPTALQFAGAGATSLQPQAHHMQVAWPGAAAAGGGGAGAASAVSTASVPSRFTSPMSASASTFAGACAEQQKGQAGALPPCSDPAPHDVVDGRLGLGPVSRTPLMGMGALARLLEQTVPPLPPLWVEATDMSEPLPIQCARAVLDDASYTENDANDYTLAPPPASCIHNLLPSLFESVYEQARTLHLQVHVEAPAAHAQGLPSPGVQPAQPELSVQPQPQLPVEAREGALHVSPPEPVPMHEASDMESCEDGDQKEVPVSRSSSSNEASTSSSDPPSPSGKKRRRHRHRRRR